MQWRPLRGNARWPPRGRPRVISVRQRLRGVHARFQHNDRAGAAGEDRRHYMYGLVVFVRAADLLPPLSLSRVCSYGLIFMQPPSLAFSHRL